MSGERQAVRISGVRETSCLTLSLQDMFPGDSLDRNQAVPPAPAAAPEMTGDGRPAPSPFLLQMQAQSTPALHRASIELGPSLARPTCCGVESRFETIGTLDGSQGQAAGVDGVQPLALQRWQCFIRSTESHLVGDDRKPACPIGAGRNVSVQNLIVNNFNL